MAIKALATTVLWLTVAVVLSEGLFAQEPNALEPGDTAVVHVERAKVLYREKVIAELDRGARFEVAKLNGEWAAGFVILQRRRQPGWVRSADLRLLAKANSGALTETAATVSFVKLGAGYEVNGRGHVHALDLSGQKVPSVALANLKALPQLAELNLSEVAVDDAGLAPLAEVETLERLYLTDTEVTDAGLSHVQGLVRLETLAANDTKIKGPGLAHLGKLADLRVLNLSGCEVADGPLAHLKRLTNLEVLALADTHVGDDGLAHLSALLQLRVLNLKGCEISDVGLAHLEKVENLRILHLEGSSVTEEGVAALKQAVGGLAVYH